MKNQSDQCMEMLHLLKNKYFIAATLSLTLLIGIIQFVFYFNQISPQDIYLNEFSNKIQPVKELISSTEDLAGDDPRLISLIRQEFLVPPHPGPYNFKEPDILNPSCGQSTAVDKILDKKEKGFYIEAGAFDGESISNTLFFERVRKWNGLLVEPDPKTYFKLRSKHRNAYLINACLSVNPKPSIVTFNAANEMGHVIQSDEDRKWVQEKLNKWDLIEVPCFPLFSILLALQQMEVDYFSLDIEGYELAVLRSIPFDKSHTNTVYQHRAEQIPWPDIPDYSFSKSGKVGQENFSKSLVQDKCFYPIFKNSVTGEIQE